MFVYHQYLTSIGVELLEWFDEVEVALVAEIDMLDIWVAKTTLWEFAFACCQSGLSSSNFKLATDSESLFFLDGVSQTPKEFLRWRRFDEDLLWSLFDLSFVDLILHFVVSKNTGTKYWYQTISKIN